MKVAFVDIDGTLVPFGDVSVPPSAAKAIKEAIAKGNKVYINTGRCRPEVLPFIADIGFSGILCSNAMYIEENGKILFKESMDAALVKNVSDWLQENNIGFFLEGHNDVFANSVYFDQLLEQEGKEKIERMKEAFPSIKENGPLQYNEIAKINFLPKKDTLDKLKAVFKDSLQVNAWSFVGKEGGMGEITAPHADKWNGVEFIMKHLSESLENTYAFGDAAGDMGMVKRCKVGIAMGNAEQCLKDVADYVTDSVRKDGLYNAFLKFGLL